MNMLFTCIVLFVIPVLMIVAGYMMWKHCPGEINYVVGYRTRRSMKNKDTWKFAHEYCGRLWWMFGWIMVASTIFVLFPYINSSKEEIEILLAPLILVQGAILVLSIIPTEKALKKKFNDDGTVRIN